ncbi:MAG: histidinol-phosphate transaminase [Chitinophagales bacterium]
MGTTKFCKKNVSLLEPYIPGYQPSAGEEVLKLNSNENPYPPSQRVLEALKDHVSNSLRLYPNSRSIELRQKVADIYGVDQQQVFCANGSDEVISLIFRTFADENDYVLFSSPTYTFYKTAAEIHGIQHTFIESDDQFRINLGDFLVVPSKITFLANPNAHTGVLLPLKEIEEFIRKYPGLLVVDETYIDFADSNQSVYPLVAKYNNLLVLRTFSKAFSLCGIRVGYAFGPPEIIEALDITKDSYNIAYLNQIAAYYALDDYQYMLNNAVRIKEDREWFKNELKKKGFNVLPSEGNFVLGCHAEFKAEKITESLKNQGILIRHINEPRLKEYIRISIGTHSQLERVLEALNDINI